MTHLSKRGVARAGQVLIDPGSTKEEQVEAESVVNEWRALHVHALEQLLNLTHSVSGGTFPTTGRIKKLDTIKDKLKRPGRTHKLSTLQDIAGCRIVVDSPDDVMALCKELKMADPSYEIVKERDWTNNPPESGYRSHHLVVRFKDLDGYDLDAELQIRTWREHAWATAVEMYDTIFSTRLKFEYDSSAAAGFFKRASYVVQCVEAGGVPEFKRAQEIYPYVEMSRETQRIVQALKAASQSVYTTGSGMDDIDAGCYCLVDFVKEDQLVSVTQLPESQAVAQYFSREMDADARDHDLVLLKGANSEVLRKLYPNYFGDISDFVTLINRHLDCFA